MNNTRSNRGGFTLMELMVAISAMTVLGLLTAPRIASAVRRTQEGSIRGELAKIRGALSVYYVDQGHYPTDNLASLVPTHLKTFPVLQVPGRHEEQRQVITETTPSDTGKWSYNNASDDAHWGEVHIGCNHIDSNARAWAGL